MINGEASASLQGLSEGDELLERFCAAAYPRLIGALTHYCGDVFLPEQLAQETLIVVYPLGNGAQFDAPLASANRVG